MSSLVFPFHDPKNIEIKFLKQVLPILKENFDNAFVSITPKTASLNPEAVAYLQQDNFFVVNFNSEDSLIGDHFVSAFTNASTHSTPEQILHLCTSDRLAFTLLTDYKKAFLDDVNKIQKGDNPVLFHRSAKAWTTHPQNYHAAEAMVTEVGKVLFGKVLDFTWCHLVITAGQLKESLPYLTAHDLVIQAQLVLNLKDIIKTQDVDWLSWEDPFIFEKDAAQFKAEREKDPAEIEKRMNYTLPEIRYLFEEYRKQH
jgi:hypothetical protein